MPRVLVGAVASLLAVTAAMQASPTRPAPLEVVFTGIVRDPAARPISGAMVRLTGTVVRASTRADGTYRVVTPAERGSEVTLTAMMVGRNPVTRTVRVSRDSMRVDFCLFPAMLDLEAIAADGASSTAAVGGLQNAPARIRTARHAHPPPRGAASPSAPPRRP